MSEWWHGFFNEDYIDIYGTEDAKRTNLEVEGVVSILAPPEDSRILDLCCGYGRHAIGLAKKGFKLTGLDFSPVLLKRALSDAGRNRTPISLVRADMRRIPFRGRFDYVINLFSAFGYFDNDEDDQTVLDCVSDALRPGGEFLLDTINRERVLSRFRRETWEELGRGEYALDERSFDLLSSRISARTLVLGQGKILERRHSMRLYTLTEIARMVETAGMNVVSVYGHLDGRDYRTDTPRMVLRAVKTLR